MNKVVLITGANGGIGRALIKKFASNGFDIIAHMREEKIDFLPFASDIEKKYNATVSELYFDLENEDEVKSGIQELIKKKMKIDVLVNNAGVMHSGLFQRTRLSDMKYVFNVNYFSTVQMTQFVSRIMVKNGGGAIVNISSIAGIDFDIGNVAYGASKAAVIAFTKTASKELASQNIRINAVAPSLTDTEMASQIGEKEAINLINQTAFKRIAKPEEIADAVYYLSSDNSTFVTGQVLRVDGGM